MSAPSPAPLSPVNYIRMFRTIASVVKASGFPPDHGCMFFAFLGAHLLRTVHGRDAVAYAGVSSFRLSERHDINFTFGIVDRTRQTAMPWGDDFHCWIDCEGYVIDLMAPLYREMWCEAARRTELLPRKIFQKPRQEMSANILALRTTGSFFVQEDVAYTRKIKSLVDDYAQLNPEFNVYVACEAWYRPAPGEMAQVLTLQTHCGRQEQVVLDAFDVSGAW